MKIVKVKPVNKAINNLAIIDTTKYYADYNLEKMGAHYYSRVPDYWNRPFKNTDLSIFYETNHHELPFSLIHRLQGDDSAEARRYLKSFEWDDDAKELFNAGAAQHRIVTEIRNGDIATIRSILTEAEIDPNDFIRRSPQCDESLKGWYVKDGNGTYPAMRPHQLASLALYMVCKFSNNWGQMRTGKTPPTLIYIYYLIATDQIDMAICVVPNSIKKIWFQEIPKDLPGEMQHLTDIIAGTRAQKERLWNNPGFIKIVNYAGLRAGLEMALESLEGKRYLLVGDEVHYVKNPDAKSTQAFRKLNPSFFVGISGTIVANKPHDVVVPINYTAPVLMTRSFSTFKEDYCRTGGAGSVVGYRKGALEEVCYRLQQISVDARRKDIGIGYGKIVQPVELEMSDVMSKVHEQITDDLIVELLSRQGSTAFSITGFLAKLARLQQAAAGYLPEFDIQGDPTGDIIWMDDVDNPKIQWLDNFIKDFIDDIEKLVIFSKFIPVIHKLYRRYAPYGAEYICGEVKPDVRVDRVNKFRQDPNCRVLIANIDIAAGFDMNPAVFAVFFNRTFYLMPNDQAEDRITGFNQEGDSTIIPLVCKGSIDEKLEFEVLPKKRQWAAKTMGREADVGALPYSNMEGESPTITQADLFTLLGVDPITKERVA